MLDAGRWLDGVALAWRRHRVLAVLPVARRPRVAILSSGDELAAPGTRRGPFQIFDSGTYGIAGLIAAGAAMPHRLARGEGRCCRHRAGRGTRACANSDLLVVIGGASVGDHDHARPALMRLGLEIAVEKIAVRPGKPTWFGMTPLGPVLGLPGNPASALVCAHLFLRR